MAPIHLKTGAEPTPKLLFILNIPSILWGFLSPWYVTSSDCRGRSQAPDMKGSRE